MPVEVFMWNSYASDAESIQTHWWYSLLCACLEKSVCAVGKHASQNASHHMKARLVHCQIYCSVQHAYEGVGAIKC